MENNTDNKLIWKKWNENERSTPIDTSSLLHLYAWLHVHVVLLKQC